MATKDGGPSGSRRPSVALCQQARSGNRKAIDELYGRYLPRLLKRAEARVGPRPRELVDTDAVARRVPLDTLEKKAPASEPSGGFLGEARQAIDARLASHLPAQGHDPDAYEQTFGEL